MTGEMDASQERDAELIRRIAEGQADIPLRVPNDR
jgi:hypothetical protein